jgi:hypothetical protein
MMEAFGIEPSDRHSVQSRARRRGEDLREDLKKDRNRGTHIGRTPLAVAAMWAVLHDGLEEPKKAA